MPTQNNYLIDTDNAIIVDVEATRAIRQAEVGATRTMIERTRNRFGLYPEILTADQAYGAAENLNWLVEDEGILPHIPVFDKTRRRDGTFANTDFVFDHEADEYTCPAGKKLKKYWRTMRTPRTGIGKDGFARYFARKSDCSECRLKARCTPNQSTRKIARHVCEGARDLAREIAETDAYVDSQRRRKKVEMLFAHLKRILKLDRLRLRGPNGAKDEFHLAATAQNLRKLAKLVPEPGLRRIRGTPGRSVHRNNQATFSTKSDVSGRDGKPPFVPGYDLVGVIDGLGSNVEGWTAGDRVADLTTIGAYSEYVCLPANRLTRVPDGVVEADALAMILSAVTPYQMLHRVAEGASRAEPAHPWRGRCGGQRDAATGARCGDQGLWHRYRRQARPDPELRCGCHRRRSG